MLTLNHFIRIVQGLSFWGFILLFLYLTFFDYESLFFYSTLLIIAPILVGLKLPIFAFYGLYKMKNEEKIDWKKKYEEENTNGKLDWEDVIHYIVIPNFKETETTLGQNLDILRKNELSKVENNSLTTLDLLPHCPCHGRT
jgi:hypothetical protein